MKSNEKQAKNTTWVRRMFVMVMVLAFIIVYSTSAFALSLRCINDDGFGNSENIGVDRMIDTGTYMYLGMENTASGTLIYRSADDGETWECISSNGINGNAANAYTCTLVWFNSKLYVGTWQLNGAAQMFRANADAANKNDIVWETITTDGFSDTANDGFTNGMVFGDYIYVGCYNPTQGSEVWRSSTGNPGSWSECAPKSWNRSDNSDTTMFYVYNNYLYAGTEMARGSIFTMKGTAIFRTAGGSGTITWTQVNSDGHGSKWNTNTCGFEVFDGYLYAGTWNPFGMQVWRTDMSGNPPWSWSRVVNSGSGSSDNDVCQAIEVLGSNIYYGSLGTLDPKTESGRFYTSSDGTTWTRITGTGFIASPANGIMCMISANGKIYLGLNDAPSSPGELWVYE